MLKYRLMSASVLITSLVLIVMFSRGWSNIFLPTTISFIASIGLLEFYYFMEQKGYQPLRKWGVCFSIIYIFTIYFVSLKTKLQVEDLALMPIFLAILTATIIIVARQKIDTALSTIASSLAGFIYVTWLLAFIMRIILWRGADFMDGRFFFLFFVVVVKSTDIGAYFYGTWFGKHKLVPKISPKKTVEGFIGGVIFASTLGAILASTLPSVHPMFIKLSETLFKSDSTILVAALGLLIGGSLSILGQFGDLAESIWKRDAKVKDSGGYIPGMGGVLDVIDSLLFPAPAMYLFMKVLENVN